MIIASSLIAALAVMLASLAGAVFIRKELGRWMHRYLRYLVTFSAGVFLAIVFHLIVEVFHEAADVSWVSLVGWIAFGALLVEVLSHLIPGAHHHHGETEHDHTHSHIDARRMLLGDAMHNVSDGLILVPAFLADIRIGIATALGIFIHELVQEVSEFFVLKEAGYTVKQALVRNFIVSSTILVGVGLSLAAVEIESLEMPLIAFSAGGFLYIILRDLLPHSVHSIRKGNNFAKHIAAGILGVLVMFGITALIPHEIEEDTLPGSESIALES